jgi:hypothetical protein
MANEEVWKFNYFTMRKYNLQKIPLKEEEEAMLFMKESTPKKKPPMVLYSIFPMFFFWEKRSMVIYRTSPLNFQRMNG